MCSNSALLIRFLETPASSIFQYSKKIARDVKINRLLIVLKVLKHLFARSSSTVGSVVPIIPWYFGYYLLPLGFLHMSVHISDCNGSAR